MPDGNPSPMKQARPGVGSSVTNILPAYPTDKFIKTLVYTKAQRLLPRDKVIRSTRRMENVMSMWKTLVTNNLQSLVVLNEDSSYFGMVDYSDIVRYVIKLFEDNISTATSMDLTRLFEKEKVLDRTEIHNIMTFPRNKGNIFHPAMVGSSLFTVFEKLYLLGNHRIPIISQNFDLKDVVTQSMAIDFLYQNIGQIGSLAETKLEDLSDFYTHTVTTTSEDGTTIDAYKVMIDQKLQGLAVVDSDGKLVDNLSLRDLKGLRPDVKVFWRLWSTVKSFKEHVREEFSKDNIPDEVIVATTEDTLSFIIETMATKHLHHIYIVDDRMSMKPTGVITQTNCLRGIMMKPSQPATTTM